MLLAFLGHSVSLNILSVNDEWNYRLEARLRATLASAVCEATSESLELADALFIDWLPQSAHA